MFGKPAPQLSGKSENPYDAVVRINNNPLVRFFGGESAANNRATAMNNAETWRERHRTADMIYNPAQDDASAFGYELH